MRKKGCRFKLRVPAEAVISRRMYLQNGFPCSWVSRAIKGSRRNYPVNNADLLFVYY